MIPLPLTTLAQVTGARVIGDVDGVVVSGPVVTDSRQLADGSMFVARLGETADGHDYVAGAAARGAVAVLVERECDTSLPQLVVADTQLAFGQVARAVVDAGRPDLQVVAITGSSGKTSTKDLLAHVLRGWTPTVAAPESFNSEIGVPITVCLTAPDTRVLIVEMGARGIGHIAYLTGIAPPDISVVLNVGYAHAGEFGSIDAVQQAKGELVEALTADGAAVLNCDDPRVAAMASRTQGQVLFTSATGASQAHVKAVDIQLNSTGQAGFRLEGALPEGEPFSEPVQLQLYGAHQVSNALQVAAVALRLGMPPAQIAAALHTATPANRWRMEVTTRADGVTIINDAYNANPDSMAAALHALASMRGTGKTWAVLGEMLELGPESATLHREVGELAGTLGVDRVVAVGEGASTIGDGASSSSEVSRVGDAEAAFQLLDGALASGDVVLFKSSRDSGLRWLGDRVAGVGG